MPATPTTDHPMNTPASPFIDDTRRSPSEIYRDVLRCLAPERQHSRVETPAARPVRGNQPDARRA